MSLNTLRKGQQIKVGNAEFLIVQKLQDRRWQLQNCATGEWSALSEDDLLDGFAQGGLSFIINVQACTDGFSAKVARDFSVYPPELLALARNREQYLKEIDRRQPIVITRKSMEPLIRAVSESIKDDKPPGWLTIWRDYRKWTAAGRDVRAIILRHADRGKSGRRSLPETGIVMDRVIDELYMTPERKRVPEVHLEIVRQLSDANRLRPEGDRLLIPIKRTIYGEIGRRSPYEIMRRATANAGPRWNSGCPSQDQKRVAHFSASPWTTLPATLSWWTTAACCHSAGRRSLPPSMSIPVLRWLVHRIRAAELFIGHAVPETRDSPEDICSAGVSGD